MLQLLLLMIVKVPLLCNAGSFYFDSMTRWPRCDDVETRASIVGTAAVVQLTR